MRVLRVRMQRFRGFENATMLPARHAVVVGEPRAGRTGLIVGLRRVLDPRSTTTKPNHLDVHRPLNPTGDGDCPHVLTEVEVTLVDLGRAIEQDLDERLELIDPQTGLPASKESADTAVMGLRLCYRLHYDPDTETCEHWVEYPKSGIRAPRAERELVAAIVLDRNEPLQLRAAGVFRQLVANADEAGLLTALAALGDDVAAATDRLAASNGVRKTIEEVLEAGAGRLLQMTCENPADDIGFVTADGSISALLRTIQPTLRLDGAGTLPLTAHGSTTAGVLAAAEAIAYAASPGAVVIADDFGDDLDAASAEYLAARLRRNSGQVWLSTRRPEVVRAFPSEEVIRLTHSHGQRRIHQLPATTDRRARVARRQLHPLLLPAMTARTVALLEGPHDLEGYTAVADRRLRSSNIAPPAAYGVRMVAAVSGDGGKDQLPKLARLAGELGFHVRIVLDNDKPGADTALVAELEKLAEQVIRLPERTAIERALVHGIELPRLRAAFMQMVTDYSLGIDLDAINDADLAAKVIEALKMKGGLHQPLIDALPEGDMPPLAVKVLDLLSQPPTATVLVEVDMP